MDGRAAVPPGLPRANPTVSYWQDPPDAISDLRSTQSLPEIADVVIIGSGISGACIAYNLLERLPDGKVVMLEARQACSGATGRNGGHTKGASYRSFMDNACSLGIDEAIKIARFEYDCIKAVHAFAREHSIECDSRELQTVDVVYDQGQWHEAVEAIGFMRKVMEKDEPAALYKLWSSGEAEKEFLTPGAVGAITYEAGSLSAYKFVIGILKLGLAKGLNLQTNMPATSISRASDSADQGRTWIVETPRGRIVTEKVVLATNGYTAHLYPALQGVIVPLRGHITAHRPGSGMPPGGLPTTYSFIYDDGYEYMIPRPPGSRFAGDIIIGGGLTKAAEEGLYEYGTTNDTTTDPEIIDYLRETTVTYFGDNWDQDHTEGRIRREWSGIMGYSADGFPLIGQMPGEEGLYITASFQGHGM
ncbi:MAG: hypothetical protein M1830_001257, partial [Pleopsidium flavum]